MRYIRLYEAFQDEQPVTQENSKISKIDWQEANKKIPVFSSFGVTDMETGIFWMMMRTSGKLHADVETLTKEDTAKMLSCFPKDSSFENSTYRPVIVNLGSERYAAALMGFPHAGSNHTPFKQMTKELSGGFTDIPNWDYNRDNGIAGHFCLHFLGSTRHTDKKEDPKAQRAIEDI
jgi:hypothetical protein